MKKIQILVSLATATMLFSCGGAQKSAETTEVEVQQKTKVTTATVAAVDVEQKSTFTGTVEAQVTNNIAPQGQSRIDEIAVEIGDFVSKGQQLVTMDATSLKQAKVQMDNNQIEFSRVDELYKIGGISRSEWDARKLSLDISIENYNNLLDNTTLLSPIDGIITSRNYDNGDMYSSGQPILVVEQIRPVKVIINISEALFANIKKGMKVDVVTDVYGDKVFTGTISLIHPKIDTSTRTFPVEVSIPNADNSILPGMFTRVTLSYGTENRVMVPDLSVVKQTGSGDRYVYIVKNGKVSFSKVELGVRVGDMLEVISGVEDKDQVMTSGHSAVTNGMEVQIIN